MTLYRMGRPFRRIKRLIEWIPVIWRTNDWDYSYMLEIWEYSLRRLRHCLETGMSKNGPQDAKNIRTYEILLKRIAEDNYLEHEWNKFFEKYPLQGDGNITLDTKNVTIHNQKHSDELTKLANQEKYLVEQDIEFFCYLFKKHMRSWWD